MKNFVFETFARLRKDIDGVTLVEYGIALAVALGVGATVYTGLSTDIAGALGAAGTAMPN